MSDKPHGPVSERYMRHHYGASGYVQKSEREGLEKVILAALEKGVFEYGHTYSAHPHIAKLIADAVRALAPSKDPTPPPAGSRRIGL